MRSRKPLRDIIQASPPSTRERRSRIVDLVRKAGEARVAELAQTFETSEVTIRADLTYLAKHGLVIRDRGGAIAPPRELTSLLGIEQRAALHADQKRRIGRAAAELVRPGERIILDAGTTAVEIVPHLAEILPLTIVANALNVALAVGTTTKAEMVYLGGIFNRESASNLGPLAEQTLADLRVNKLFLGTQALAFESGLTDTTMQIAQIKRAMMKAAEEVILVADSSKWDTAGFIKVAPVSAVHHFITDTGLPAEGRSVLERAGLRLTLV